MSEYRVQLDNGSLLIFFIGDDGTVAYDSYCDCFEEFCTYCTLFLFSDQEELYRFEDRNEFDLRTHFPYLFRELAQNGNIQSVIDLINEIANPEWIVESREAIIADTPLTALSAGSIRYLRTYHTSDDDDAETISIGLAPYHSSDDADRSPSP